MLSTTVPEVKFKADKTQLKLEVRFQNEAAFISYVVGDGKSLQESRLRYGLSSDFKYRKSNGKCRREERRKSKGETRLEETIR